MKYGIFYGCAVPTRIPSVEKATAHVLESLGIEAFPLKDMACCMDPIVLKSLSHDAWLAVAARNLAVAGEQGADAVLTLCNGCFCSLNETARMIAIDPALRERTNEVLGSIGKTYDGGTKVQHLAAVLDGVEEEKLEGALSAPLDGRKIATFHGCHLVRPSDYAEVDDPVRPKILDRLVHRMGGEPVAYSDTNRCCGMGFSASAEKEGLEALAETLGEMAEAGAELITTPCPSCLLQLESAQRLTKALPPMPVLHIAELFALALGLTEQEIGLQYHRVKMPKKEAATA